MNGLSRYGIVVARVLLSVVFVLNGLGIIDQTVPLKELMEHGLPVAVVRGQPPAVPDQAAFGAEPVVERGAGRRGQRIEVGDVELRAQRELDSCEVESNRHLE